MESLITVSANQPPHFLSHNHSKVYGFRSSWKLRATESTTTSGRGFSTSPTPNSLKKNTKKNRVPGEPTTLTTSKTTRRSTNPRITSQGGRNEASEEDSVMAQVVVQRMIVRMLGYVGVPLVVGFATLQIIGTLKERGILDVPMWVAFFAILVTFGGSTVGIVYGALSTSWDPDKEGSFLGFEEAVSNWDDMWMEDNGDSK